MNTLEHFYKSRRLDTLVENKTTFAAEQSELNIYETHLKAHKVSLTFDVPVLTTMLQGKKVMHLRGMDSFDYFPGSSVLMPSHEEMRIDFPEASTLSPTKCLALAISPEKVEETVHLANESLVRASEDGEWSLTEENFYFLNDSQIHRLLQRIISIFLEGHTSKDVFVDFCMKELLIRLMQTHAGHLLIEQSEDKAHKHRMSFVIRYIRENLDREISVTDLAGKACMSESHFYKCFKNTFGFSPVEFILSERMEKAKSLLLKTRISITQVSLSCGFRHHNYFSRQFRKFTGLSPTAYRKKHESIKT